MIIFSMIQASFSKRALLLVYLAYMLKVDGIDAFQRSGLSEPDCSSGALYANGVCSLHLIVDLVLH